MITKTEHGAEESVITINQDKLLGPEAGEIQSSVLDLIDKGTKRISIELSRVEYVTSWGIGILVHAFTTCTNREIDFTLIGVTDRVGEILNKVKLNKIFNIRKAGISTAK
jgi:anti-anti-sigma factor